MLNKFIHRFVLLFGDLLSGLSNLLRAYTLGVKGLFFSHSTFPFLLIFLFIHVPNVSYAQCDVGLESAGNLSPSCTDQTQGLGDGAYKVVTSISGASYHLSLAVGSSNSDGICINGSYSGLTELVHVATATTFTVSSHNTAGAWSGNSATLTYKKVPPPSTLNTITGTTPIECTGAEVLTASAPTGGTISYADGYRIHTFTSSGTFTVPTGFVGNVEVLVVAGGGGGAGDGGSTEHCMGSGGAGGVVYTGASAVTASAYGVTIGAGGSGGAGGGGTNGNSSTNGGNSTFNGITATGGGAGKATTAGAAGGSGGGAGAWGFSGAGGAGSQGNNGGSSQTGNAAYHGGGGGGAGATGGNNTGVGGAGISYSISGGAVTYAAGGSHGGAAATANTGNGGGGGLQNNVGTAGGSGIVIIRYHDVRQGTWSSQNTAIATVSGSTVVTDGSEITVTAASTGAASSTNIAYTYTNTGGCSVVAYKEETVGTTDITVQPVTPAAFCAGAGTANLSVTATGTALTYQWRKDGVNLTNVAPYSNVTTSTMTITSPAVANGGEYDVVVTSNAACSTISDAVAVTVLDAPQASGAITGTTALSCSGTSVLTTAGLASSTLPTGGTITTDGNDRIHTFTTDGNFATEGFSGNIEVLMVGGGGSGGPAIGGGGGGGGVVYLPNATTTAATTYPIVIGTGGVSTTTFGASGTATTAFGATAAGGGSSGKHDTGNGTDGGSAGGAASNNGVLNVGGSATGSSLGAHSGTIFGHDGGDMTAGRTGGPTRAAGGGGAGAASANTNSNSMGLGYGTGGAGIAFDIYDGTLKYWAGGGGGGSHTNTNSGNGGIGGGGGGGEYSGTAGTGGGSAWTTGATGSVGANVAGGAGGANTGGGGGGGTWSTGLGGTGGTGIVIIRYTLPNPSDGLWSSDDPSVTIGTTTVTATGSSTTITGDGTVGSGANVSYTYTNADGCVSTAVTTAVTVAGCSTITLAANTVAAATDCPSDVKVPIQAFSAAITVGDGDLTDLDFTTTGTYVQADIGKYQLWYNTSNSLATASQVGVDLASSGTAGARSFATFTSPTLTNGNTYYFWITVDLTSTASGGLTLACNATATGDLTYAGVVAGSTTAGGTQTIGGTSTLVANTVSAANVCASDLKVPIQAFQLDQTVCDGNLTNVGFTTTGTYVDADLAKYQLWYNTSNSLAGASQVGSDLASSGGGAGARTFAAFTTPTLTAGNSYYFWITVDITASPTNSTLACNAIATTDLTAISAKAGSTTAGGTQTISGSVTLASNTVAAADLCISTLKTPIQSFSLAPATCDGNFTDLDFTTTGTYVVGDIDKYQLWYSSSNSLSGATQVGVDLASAGGAGARSFATFTSPTLTAGTTYYFWITVDVSASPVSGNTLAVNAIATGDITYVGSKSGSTTAGGTQTVLALPAQPSIMNSD